MIRTIVKYSLLIVSFGMIFTTINTGEVIACSGGAPLTIKALINHSDYVVKARVAEADDLQQNVILHVETYLAGGPGPEYLLWVRNDPIFVNYVLAGRSTGGDCLGLAYSINPGKTTYLFLHRNDNGSYEVVTTLFNPYEYTFPTPDSTVEIFLKGGFKNGDTVYEDFADKGSGQQVTESDFLKTVSEQSGEMPLPPDQSKPYPLKAPLQLTTSSGNQYLFPVDGQPLIKLTPEEQIAQQQGYPLWTYGFSDAGKCETADCRSISPDGLNIAVQTDENTITLTQRQKIVGQASLFSSTSDTIAVWNKCQLTIYTLGYPRLFEDWYKTVELNHQTLNGEKDCAEFFKFATWSPDGRLLAYSDAQGLWLWDVFDSNREPRLLIATTSDGIPFARNFSPMGRYLSVNQGSKNYISDVLSGDILPDGLISPDDRLLLKFDTTAPVFDLEICAIVPYNCQAVRNMYLAILDDRGEVTQLYDGLHLVNSVQWEDKNNFIVLACVPEKPALCSVFQWFPSFSLWERSAINPRARSFDYDPVNHSLAVVTGTASVVIDRSTYDLSGMVDSDIIEIKWLLSLFYQN